MTTENTDQTLDELQRSLEELTNRPPLEFPSVTVEAMEGRLERLLTPSAIEAMKPQVKALVTDTLQFKKYVGDGHFDLEKRLARPLFLIYIVHTPADEEIAIAEHAKVINQIDAEGLLSGHLAPLCKVKLFPDDKYAVFVFVFVPADRADELTKRFGVGVEIKDGKFIPVLNEPDLKPLFDPTDPVDAALLAALDEEPEKA